MSDFLQEDKINTTLKYKDLFVRMTPYFRKYWLSLGAVIVMVILMAVISRLIPTLIGYAVDESLLKKNNELLIKLLFFYIGLEITHALLDLLQLYFFQKLGARVLFNLREDLITKIQSYPIDYFNKNPIGRIVTRATNDVAQIGELFSDGVVNIFVQSLTLISILIAIFIISPKIALLTLVSFPFFVYFAFELSEKIKETLRESKKKLSELNSFVAENLNGIKIVQLYNRIHRNRAQFETLSSEYKDLSLESTRNYALMMPIMNILNAVTITSAFYFIGVFGRQEFLAVGSMVAFFLHALDIVHPFREIIEKYQQFQNSLTSAERVFSMLDEPTEHHYKNSELNTKFSSGFSSGFSSELNGEKFKADIEFRNLNFSYERSSNPVLKNINLHINRNDSVAIIGKTGSGKSTLINLLQGFYKAPENSIFISHISIENIPRDFLRKKIAAVQQDNFIFKGNIWSNISLESNLISFETIEKIAIDLGIVDHLKLTGRNLFSTVEEKGANLSAGERQLIAFARILAFAPDVIILDEATSNIDSQTEQLIQVATEKIIKNRTSIIIAHRLSTIRNCNKIIILDQGRILEVGTHQQLMENSNHYRELIEKYHR
ncbi:MAG: ABC transporter ATP-binding protein [Deltaproteobacteria bacterium]|nr:ABC transporter ATP-binding protein [Deltaproteobacteria bacterium]